jgi:uncharacterized membrane protein YphA (DoxX/SURF4 family)
VSRFLNWRGHSWLALAARMYLGWVFVYACLHKIAHPHAFALDIATYDILPLAVINLMAITLPWVELFAGAMLIVGFRVRGASLAVAGMMVMFLLAIIIALAKGLDLSCGCFASQTTKEDPISYLTVLRDAGWFFLAVYVAIFDRKALGIDRLLKKRRKPHA